MAESAVEKRKEPYIGEKQKCIRNGYGTYVYENQFFRYEGEWVKGKKHGHGKLTMKDGTFYEGQFTDGEITGSGYKFFSTSNAKYTGEFLCGEMHGNGMMTYRDGSVYKGQWYKNRRQGFGTLWTQTIAMYEGSFYDDLKNGEGRQTYDGSFQKLSNGDKYEGHWVQDKRNGHGQLWCADGSYYEGNFVNDLFHGEGKINHASGIYYRGLWVNGFPEKMATKLVILCESPLMLKPGDKFSISVECRNDDDELVAEQGRQLQLLAGFKYTEPEESSGIFDMIEDLRDQPISTPFGYDVVPYPITDQMPKFEEPEPIEEEELIAELEAIEEVKSSDLVNEVQETTNPESELVTEVSAVIPESDSRDQINQPSENIDSSEADKINEVLEEKHEELLMVPQVQNKVSTNGLCEWNNLQLAPPPPMYRPFVILKKLEEAKKQPKLSKEKLEIVEEKAEKSADFLELKNLNESIDEGEEKVLPVEHSESIHSKTLKNVESNASKNNPFLTSETNSEENFSESEQNTFLKERKSSQLHTSQSKERRDSYETVARPGEYVITVKEVTNPPFLGKTLKPAFLLLQLVMPRKSVSLSRKPKWDTQKFIATSMHHAS